MFRVLFLATAGGAIAAGRQFMVEMRSLIGAADKRSPSLAYSQLPLRSASAVASFVSIACLSWPCGLSGLVGAEVPVK